MAVKKRKLPTKFDGYEAKIFDMVSKLGVSKAHVCKAFGLGHNYFNIFVGTNDNYERGKTAFVETLMKITVKNLPNSDANRKYLMQKLRIFDGELDLPLITDTKSAQKALAICIQSYGKGDITAEQLNDIKTSCSTYVDLNTNVVLQEKIEKLEELFKEKFKTNGK